MVCGILQYRIGFSDGEIAIGGTRYGLMRIDLGTLWRLVLTGEVVYVIQLVVCSKQIKPGENVPTIDGARVEVHFE